MGDSRIVVWIPIFNEAPYLTETIQSVLSQSHEDLIVVASDNHSVDQSRDIIEFFASRDPRVQIIQPPEHCGGFYHNLFIHEVVSAMDCSAVMQLGGHDLLAPDCLRYLKESLDRYPTAAMVSPRGARMHDNGTIEGFYPDMPHLKDTPRVANPLSILSAVTFNVANLALVRKSVYDITVPRYPCYGFDLLLVSEMTVNGGLIVDPRAVTNIRAQTRNDSFGVNYQVKALGTKADMQSSVDQFNMQLRWIQDIATLAVRDYPYVDQRILAVSMMGSYYARWAPIQFSQPWKQGAFQQWIDSEIGKLFTGGLTIIADGLREHLRPF